MTDEKERGGSGDARRKVLQLEQELVQVLHKHNEETTSLQSDIAKLRASLEHGEAGKQKLEYALFVSRQEVRKLEDHGRQKEQEYSQLTGTLQSRVAQLSKQCQDWSHTLDSVQEARAQERVESQQIIAAKEGQLSNALAHSREVETELDQLKSTLSAHTSTLDHLQAKLTSLEVECEEKTGAVLQQGRELQQANQQERQLMQQLQDKMEQVKTLEETLQAEKAAHLDSKFTAEIAQLRLKELESSADAEKNSKAELSATLEQANENISKLQHQLDEENYKVIELSDKLLSKELEYTELQQHMREQLGEKDSKLTVSTQQAQQQIDVLQAKLDQLSQRETKLRGEHDTLVQGVLTLLSATGTGGRGSSGGATPTELLQQLHDIMSGQEQRVLLLDQQLKVANENAEQLSAECNKYKDVLSTRSSAIADAEKQLAHHSDQLSRVQEEMLTLNTSHERERQHLREQLEATKNEWNAENETHCRFLHSLHAQLGSHDLTQQAQLLGVIGNTPSRDWAYLSSVVAKETATICDSYKNLHNKLAHLETSCEQLKTELSAEQQSHQQDVDQLATQQVHQLEQADQYQKEVKMMSDNVHRLQECCHDYTNQINQLKAANQMLAMQQDQHKATIDQLNVERSLLLPAVAMLTGTVYPLLARQQQLIVQKAVLSWQLSQLDRLRHVAMDLVDMLQSINDPVPPVLPSPLLRFRKVAIVILAANRMLSLRHHSNCLLTGKASSLPMMTMHTGGHGHSRGFDWLKGNDILDDVTSSLSHMISGQWDLSTVKNCYCQLLGQLNEHFTSSNISVNCWTQMTTYPFQITSSNQSLWQRLARGLAAIAHNSHGNNPVELSGQLKSQLLILTGKLHDGELDRHSLHQQLVDAKLDYQQLSVACNDALSMATTVEKLQQELRQMVPADQYSNLGNQLQLARQQLAEQQDIISHHDNHIHQLDQRLTAYVQQVQQKDQELREASQELLQLKEKQVLQAHQVKELTSQHDTTQQQLSHVQHLLATASREQQSLEQFLTMATAAFKQSQEELSSHASSMGQQLHPLLAELMAKPSNECSKCQEMVRWFLSAHQSAVELIHSLHTQVESYKTHTNALKAELNAACRRQLTSMAASLDYQEDEPSLDKSGNIATQGALLGVSMAKSLNLINEQHE